MQWHLPLSCLGLQQAHRIGPDADKPPQVALCCDVLRHEPTDLPRAHACEQPEEQCTVQHPVLGCQQDADLVIRQHPMGMTSGLSLTLRASQGLALQLPFTNTPVKELGHLLEDTGLGLGCQSDALSAPERACKLSQASLLPLPVLAHVGRELGDVPQHLLSMAQGQVTNSMLAQMRGQQLQRKAHRLVAARA